MVTTDPRTRQTTTIYYRDYIIAELGKPGWLEFVRLMRRDNEFRFDVVELSMGDVLQKIRDGLRENSGGIKK
jgi:hypothetical protein